MRLKGGYNSDLVVATRKTLRGTHRGEMWGLAPTGNRARHFSAVVLLYNECNWYYLSTFFDSATVSGSQEATMIGTLRKNGGSIVVSIPREELERAGVRE